MRSYKKINYITNGKRASLIAKSGETERYFIVAIGKDSAEPKYAGIKTAFVASAANRYDSDIAIYEGEDALELRIPMSSFGENQRFRGASERQDRSSDYPVTAASSPSEGTMPQVGRVVKAESLSTREGRAVSLPASLARARRLGASTVTAGSLPGVMTARALFPRSWMSWRRGVVLL